MALSFRVNLKLCIYLAKNCVFTFSRGEYHFSSNQNKTIYFSYAHCTQRIHFRVYFFPEHNTGRDYLHKISLFSIYHQRKGRNTVFRVECV